MLLNETVLAAGYMLCQSFGINHADCGSDALNRHAEQRRSATGAPFIIGSDHREVLEQLYSCHTVPIMTFTYPEDHTSGVVYACKPEDQTS